MTKPTLKLYDLTADYLEALDTLAEIEDLPPEVIADTLEGISGAWEDKALNVARYVRNLEAEAAAKARATEENEEHEETPKRRGNGEDRPAAGIDALKAATL